MTNGIGNNFFPKELPLEIQQGASLSSQEEIIFNEQTQINQENNLIEENNEVEYLSEQLNSIKDEQGLISNIWNGIKCLTNIGSSTEKCEKAIEQYKNGEITLAQAQEIISSFQDKQGRSLEIASNIVTGVSATAAGAAIVAASGFGIGLLAGLGIGALTKTALKFFDRVTNDQKGDALDSKQIISDLVSGGVDGVVSVATLGFAPKVSITSVLDDTLRHVIGKGAFMGGVEGAISGGASGATEYLLEAALDEDKYFSFEELAIITAENAAGGALGGAFLGGVGAKNDFKKMQDLLQIRKSDYKDLSTEMIEILSKRADELAGAYKANQTQPVKEMKTRFGDFGKVTGRSKSSNSIFEKLAKKATNGELPSSSLEDCHKAIADAYGTRIQLKSLTKTDVDKVLADKGIHCTSAELDKFMSGDITELDDSLVKILEKEREAILNSLKEKQTGPLVERLIYEIEHSENPLIITELNNYGNDVSSYFTKGQLESIAKTYHRKTGEKLNIVTRYDESFGTWADDEFGNLFLETDDLILSAKKAIKDGGYATSQFNVQHTLKDGTIGLGEWQVRGIETNDYSEVEHVIYDSLSGKIKPGNKKYDEVYTAIRMLSPASLAKYNQYTTAVWDYSRLKELGITIPMPKIGSGYYTETGYEVDVFSLTREALKKFENKWYNGG